MGETKTIADWLAERYPQAKKTTLREMIEHKRVTLNGVSVKSLKQPVGETDKVVVGEVTGPTGTIAEGVEVVHQDADILVINKPSGLLTSTHEDEPRPTAIAVLNDYVQTYNQKAQAFVVHRLDRDASGLLVFARNHGALNKLKAQFAEHAVDRQYTAVVHGVFRKPSGRLENLLYEDERGIVHVTKEGAREAARAKPAILDYEVLRATTRLTLVRCTLQTGRKHQIRVQLKSVGHPICGDVVYGTPAARQGEESPFRLALHATHLGFVHPKSGKNVIFDSPAPDEFGRLIHGGA